jgi:O-antigen/teichoic acid export membrane protein
MKKLISKLRKLEDYGSNILAFGVLIFVQQFLMFPYIAKIATAEEFAFVIIFFSINAIVSTVIGQDLGTTRIVNNTNQQVNVNNYKNFFYLLLCLLNGFGIAVVFFIDLKSAIFFTCLLITNLSTLRVFLISEFRMRCEFENILLTNFLYAIGAIIGITAMHWYDFFLLPLISSEVVSVIYLLRKNGSFFSKIAESKWMNKSSIIDYASLASISGISSTLMYFDRLLLLPILGPHAVAVYFVASSMSKSLLLIVNPISNVMLSKLAISNNNNRLNKRKTILIILVILISSSIVSYMIASVAIKLLYPQFYIDSVKLLVPISIATGFCVCSSLIKPIILIQKGPVRILYIQIAQAMLLIALTLTFLKELKLYGFAWFLLLTNMFELTAIIYSFSQIKLKKNIEFNTLKSKA